MRRVDVVPSGPLADAEIPGCTVRKSPSRAVGASRTSSAGSTSTVEPLRSSVVSVWLAVTVMVSSSNASCAREGAVQSAQSAQRVVVRRYVIYCPSIPVSGIGVPRCEVIGKDMAPPQTVKAPPLRKDRYPRRAPRPDRVITSAGLLTRGSLLYRAFPSRGVTVAYAGIARRLQLRGQLRN